MELFTKLSEIMGEGCTLAITIAKTKKCKLQDLLR